MNPSVSLRSLYVPGSWFDFAVFVNYFAICLGISIENTGYIVLVN